MPKEKGVPGGNKVKMESEAELERIKEFLKETYSAPITDFKNKNGRKNWINKAKKFTLNRNEELYFKFLVQSVAFLTEIRAR